MIPINLRVVDTSTSKQRRSAMGPIAYTDLSQGLNHTLYSASYSAGELRVNGVPLFTLAGILEYDLAFDVQGNPFVAYSTVSGVSIYWFNPVEAIFKHDIVTGGGSNPFCYLDLRGEAVSSIATITVVYHRSAEVKFSSSLDRFTTEYSPGISLGAVGSVQAAGMSDNELQHVIELSGV